MKITPLDYAKIRQEYQPYVVGAGRQDIAKKYGVSVQMISKIKAMSAAEISRKIKKWEAFNSNIPPKTKAQRKWRRNKILQ